MRNQAVGGVVAVYNNLRRASGHGMGHKRDRRHHPDGYGGIGLALDLAVSPSAAVGMAVNDVRACPDIIDGNADITNGNIGRINTHNTNSIVEPMRITNTLTTFFIWLKPEVEVLPRLFDMLLFVFIVRHFFICISTIGFSLLDTHRACEASEDVRPLTEKYELTNGRSGDFSAKRQKNIPATHVSPTEQIEICLLVLQ